MDIPTNCRSILEAHYSYTTKGTFTNKQDAESVLWAIRAAMDDRFVGFSPLSVELQGKRGAFWIEMPRIMHHWGPLSASSADIAQELAHVANEFATIYERK